MNTLFKMFIPSFHTHQLSNW